MRYSYLVIIVFLSFLSFISCISITHFNDATKQAYIEGQTKATKDCTDTLKSLMERADKLEIDDKLKTARLKTLNQVDEEGKLMPIKYKIDTDKPKPQ